MGDHAVRRTPHRRGPVAAAVPGRSREVPVAAEQVRRAHGVGEQTVDPVERVVTGRPRHGPPGRQGLGTGEDLLHHRPPAPAPVAEPPEIRGRVGQPVRMVDAQPVDDSVADQLQDLAVGGGEDLRVLHPDADQIGDGEEPPVVQLGPGQPPPGEPVVLGGQQLRQRKVRRPLAQGELQVAVAEHGGPVAAGARLEAAALLADAPRQHGQQHLPAARRPVDVEPAGVRGLRALAQHLPQRQVVPGRGGHVVRHDVQDDPEAVGACRTGQLPQALLAPELGPHGAVVDDVVAVPRTGYGLKDGGQMQMGDAEPGEIRHGVGGGGEREVRLELEPVRGGGRHGLVRTQPGAALPPSGPPGTDRVAPARCPSPLRPRPDA